MNTGLLPGPDGRMRCAWHGGDVQYIRYHDTEWGRPTADDRYLFEKICLEGFQAGLSWLTILRKREHFRTAFDEFDFKIVSRYGDKDVERLLQNTGIVRHRGKIESVINNARHACVLAETYGSLAAYFWQWEPETGKKGDVSVHIVPDKTPESTALSKDLKRRGWSFVGPVTIYSFMQAVGMVNDHLEGCFCRPEIESAKANFLRPV